MKKCKVDQITIMTLRMQLLKFVGVSSMIFIHLFNICYYHTIIRL